MDFTLTLTDDERDRWQALLGNAASALDSTSGPHDSAHGPFLAQHLRILRELFLYPDPVTDLIEQTSLGTPEAIRHRRNTPPEVRHEVLARLPKDGR